VYFRKSLDQLTLAETATIGRNARVPPSRDNPVANPSAAKLRRL